MASTSHLVLYTDGSKSQARARLGVYLLENHYFSNKPIWTQLKIHKKQQFLSLGMSGSAKIPDIKLYTIHLAISKAISLLRERNTTIWIFTDSNSSI